MRRKFFLIVGGLGDSGFAAAGNFAAGLYAVNVLTTNQLALYSLFFSGWVVAQLLPAQVVYLPSRLYVNSLPNMVAPKMRRDVLRAGPISAVAAVGVSFAGLPLSGSLTTSQYIIAAVPVALLVVISPLQDHIRRTLHILGLHTGAAWISATTFVAISLSMMVIMVSGLLPSSGAPFGALAVGNLVGACAGAFFLRRHERITSIVPRLRERVSYLGPDFLGQTTGYIVAVVAASALGASALASLETARVMASPVMVIVSGLAAALVPPAVRNFGNGRLKAFQAQMLRVSGGVVGVGALYSLSLVLAGSRLDAILGQHANGYLGASRSLVTTIDSAATGASVILFSAGRTALWTATALAGSVVTLLLVYPAALVLGPFGVVAAQGAGSGIKSGVGLALALRSRPRTT